MEESSEGHSEGNKSAPDSNKKRIVKSRAQIEALEKFYEEHKYPKEMMKAEFAVSMGLTEKQVSGWFCHRRLKDKKIQSRQLANGRQDRSSGIMQDRGSGLKQDSCGSTKQGGDRNFDPREVESKRVTSQDYAAIGVNYEFGGHYTSQAGSPDDTTSRSSSSEQNIPLHRYKDPLSMASSRSQTLSTPVEMKGVRGRAGPSGYLKVKCQIEHAAITAVKWQLGRHYRIDGPPLAVEFDHIPFGAFESPMQEAHDGPYYTEEASLSRSFDASLVQENSHRAIGYDYNLKTSSHNSDDGTRIKRAHVSDHSESQHKHKHKLPAKSYANEPFSGKGILMDMHEGSMIEAPIFESRYSYDRIKHGGSKILDSYPGENVGVNHLQAETGLLNYNDTHTKAVASEDFENYTRKSLNYNDTHTKAVASEDFENYTRKSLNYNDTHTKAVASEDSENYTRKSYEHVGVQQKGPSRRMTKEVKLFGERIAAIEDFGSGPGRPRILPMEEFRAVKRAKNAVLSQSYYGKTSPSEAPSWTNLPNWMPRPANEIQSSFSEDEEAAGTSSSAD